MRRWFVVLVDTNELRESVASAHEISTRVVDEVVDHAITNRLRDADRPGVHVSGSATVELAAAEAVARVVQRRA